MTALMATDEVLFHGDMRIAQTKNPAPRNKRIATTNDQLLDITQKAVKADEDSFRKNWDRIRNGPGLPIEALEAIQALATARREYVRVVANYNQAQFTLERSLGWPITESPIVSDRAN